MTRTHWPLWATIASGGLSAAVAGLLAMAVPWTLIASGAGTAWAGVASFAVQIPLAAGLAVGGLLGDAYGPRRVLIGSGLTALPCVILAALVAGSTHPLLTVVVGMLALANFAAAAGDVAQESRMPELARLAGWPLARANAAAEIAGGAGMPLGAGAAVLLIDRIGLSGALWVAVAASIVVIAIDLAFFPRFAARRVQAPTTGCDSAFRTLRRDPVLLVLVAIGVLIVGAFVSSDEILVPALAVQAGLGAPAVARFLLLLAASSTAATLLYAWRGHRPRAWPLLLACLWLTAFGFAALALLPPAWALLLAPLLIGAGAGPLGPLLSTIVQRRTGAAMRGRVLGILGGSIMIVQPFAALVGGPAAQWLGVATVLRIVAAMVVVGAWLGTAHAGLRAALSGREG